MSEPTSSANAVAFRMILILILFLVGSVASLPPTVTIGGLFEENDEYGKLMLKVAADQVNADDEILPETKLLTVEETVSEFDSFNVGKVVCSMMESGVAGIIGPHSPETSDHVQSLCDTFEVPHITMKWDPRQRRSSCSVNFYPHQSVLAKAVMDLIVSWNFGNGFTIMYEDSLGLMKMGSILSLADEHKGYIVSARQLVGAPGEEMNFRPIMQEIKHSGVKNLVVECSGDKLFDVLLQAQQVGIMGSDYNYIITSLDFQSIDLDPFKWSGTNITGFRIVNPEHEEVKEVFKLISEAKLGVNVEPSEPDETEEPDETNEEVDEERKRKRRKVSTEDDEDGEDNTNDDNEDGDEEEEEEEEEEENKSEESDVIGEVEGTQSPNGNGDEEEPDYEIPPIEAILVYDAVMLMAKAMHSLDLVEPRPINCADQQSWEAGFSIINYMKMSELDGLTGRVKFDNEGFRTEISLEVIELTENGLSKRGDWNMETGITMYFPPQGEPNVEFGDDLRNASFIVLIALTQPYGMLKESSQTLTGNDRYEGFGIDLIHELSLMCGFNYTFKEQKDKSSGNPKTLPNGTRVWNGMIGEVQAGRADLAIADITITRERGRDADFTMPFMNLGISILYRKPGRAPPDLFSFLSPFTYEVWGYMMSAYLGVSFLLFITARISPPEWTNPYPCIEEPTELENQFSLLNSLWFTIGSLMQQGSELAPISVSTRMIASIWWFFTLIMVSSYTANLAAFLTIETKVWAFRSVEELANQDKIVYGAKAGGSTAGFFRESNEPIYQKMWKFMDEHPDVMPSSNDAGVNRVMTETNYAFLMESTSIEYEVERKCGLTQVGGLLDNKGYGIVMRQNSSYRNILSRNVVKLQEKGKLTALKNKWWKEKRGGGACLETAGGGEASELNLDNVGGVFVVLLGGCIFAVFLSMYELVWDIYTRENKVSFKEELMEEIRFISRCHGTTKPVRKPLDEKSSLGSSTRDQFPPPLD